MRPVVARKVARCISMLTLMPGLNVRAAKWAAMLALAAVEATPQQWQVRCQAVE